MHAKKWPGPKTKATYSRSLPGITEKNQKNSVRLASPPSGIWILYFRIFETDVLRLQDASFQSCDHKLEEQKKTTNFDRPVPDVDNIGRQVVECGVQTHEIRQLVGVGIWVLSRQSVKLSAWEK